MSEQVDEDDVFEEELFPFGEDVAVRYEVVLPRPGTSDDNEGRPVYHIEVYGEDDRHLGTIKTPTTPEDVMVFLINDGVFAIRDYDEDYEEYRFLFGDARAVRYEESPPRPDTSDDYFGVAVYHLDVFDKDGRRLGTIKKPTKFNDIMVVWIIEGILTTRDYESPR